MRTISADHAAILAGFQSTQVRIQVKDAGGTFRDLMTYPTFDALEEITWGEEVDSLGVQWSATLTREQAKISLSPFMAASPLNHNFDPATSATPLLQVGRLMKVEYSIQANGDPRARTWALAFQGYVEAINAGGRDTVSIEGRGLEAQLQNAYIERERIYAFAQGGNATAGVYVWDASRAWALGDLVVPTDTKRNDHFYEVTVAGAGAATEPVWPTGGGSTVASGGATFTEAGATSASVGTAIETVLQQILNDNGFGAVTLWVPTSPSYAVKNFKLNRQPLFEALRNIADGTIGWCLRYMDDAGSPRLKLFDPLRSTTTSLRTFPPTEIVEDGYSRVEVRLENIRNAVDVTFSDAQDLDSSGNPKRKTVSRTDSASITKYGRLFCAVAESSTSNIDTTSEATALADRMLSDLAEPTADLEAELLYLFPFVELCDLYTFAADGVHFDSDQKLAVSSYSHRIDARVCSTTLRIRGKPASQSAAGWYTMLEDAVGSETHALTALENTTPISLTADTLPVGGTRIAFDWAQTRKAKDTTFELHLSTSSGFTPSSATLVAAGKERAFEVGNLDPSFEHYAVLVPITWNESKPIRGQPSAELAFTPGRAMATHLNPEVAWGVFPLNGSFETQIDPAEPPDFWSMGYPGAPIDTGDWGTNADLILEDPDGLAGANTLRLLPDASVGAALTSALFAVNELEPVALRAWAKNVSGGSIGLQIGFLWLDETGSAISDDGESIAVTSAAWIEVRTKAFVPPTGARFARSLVGLGIGVAELHVDSVAVDDERWHLVGGAGEAAFTNSWVAHTAGTNDPGYRQADKRHGEMKGAAKNGSSGTAAIFTLPGYLWPKTPIRIPIDSNGAYGVITISTAGVVAAAVGNTTLLCLDGVRWALD